MITCWRRQRPNTWMGRQTNQVREASRYETSTQTKFSQTPKTSLIVAITFWWVVKFTRWQLRQFNVQHCRIFSVTQVATVVISIKFKSWTATVTSSYVIATGGNREKGKIIRSTIIKKNTRQGWLDWGTSCWELQCHHQSDMLNRNLWRSGSSTKNGQATSWQASHKSQSSLLMFLKTLIIEWLVRRLLRKIEYGTTELFRMKSMATLVEHTKLSSSKQWSIGKTSPALSLLSVILLTIPTTLCLPNGLVVSNSIQLNCRWSFQSKYFITRQQAVARLLANEVKDHKQFPLARIVTSLASLFMSWGMSWVFGMNTHGQIARTMSSSIKWTSCRVRNTISTNWPKTMSTHSVNLMTTIQLCTTPKILSRRALTWRQSCQSMWQEGSDLKLVKEFVWVRVTLHKRTFFTSVTVSVTLIGWLEVFIFFFSLECGRTFQDNTGSFTSPSYYISTNEPEKCEWRITATHGERIILNITDLVSFCPGSSIRLADLYTFQDIFKSENCRSDFLEIRDGYWHKSPVLGRFCGSGKVNELIITTGSRMLLTFTNSLPQPSLRGFAASYEGKKFHNRRVQPVQRKNNT